MYPPDPRELDDDDAPEAGSEATEGDEDALDGDDGDGEDDIPAGDEAESTSGETETGEDVDPEPEPRRKVTANDRIRNLSRAEKAAKAEAAERARERDEARGRADAAERRAEQAERDANTRRQTETAEQEAARLELMSSDEKVAFYRDKDRREHQNEMAGVKFQIWDSTDRTEFRQLVRDDPLVARVKEKVETEYERLRAAGRPVSREILANQEIAKMVRENRGKAAERQKKRGAETVRRETTRPMRARSDVAPNRTRRGEEDSREARRKRLEGVEL